MNRFRCSSHHVEVLRSGGDAEYPLIAHLGVLGVRARSGRCKNPLPYQPLQRSVEPLKNEGNELARRQLEGLLILSMVSHRRQQAVNARWTSRWMANTL
jgi:hypothetical protein